MSPITRERAKIYPADWKAISLAVRARSGGRCECAGECGRLHIGRCTALNGAIGARRRDTDEWMKLARVIDVVGMDGDNDSFGRSSQVVRTLISKETRELPVVLDVAVQLAAGKDLGLAVERLDELETEHARIRKELKTAADDLRDEISDLAKRAREGSELRMIDVEVWGYHESGRVLAIRKDTGEVIQNREMTADEKQLPIDFVGTDPEPPTVVE